MFRKIFSKIILHLFLITAYAALNVAHSQTIIRDAEIENTLKAFSTKIFEVANLNPENVSIHIIKDNRINAFITKGQNLFIHTGLLIQSETPEQVIGVIAHETGHMAGGHIARLMGQNEKTGKAMLLSTIAGGAAMLASGRADVGSAVALGGMSSSMGSYFSYRRSEENAADDFAVKALDKTNQSAKGLLEFLKKINRQDALISDNQDPYFRTHPLTPDRISFLDNHVKSSKHSDSPSPEAFNTMHKRMKAKLMAFIDNPILTLNRYPKTDNSLIARYSRAIAFYKQLKIDDAVKELDILIEENPEDPYFYELKGQILFENTKIEDSIPYYEKALKNLPDNPLIMLGLAGALIENEKNDNLEKAVSILRRTVTLEKNNASAWRLLASAYGRLNNITNASEASAEYNFIIGDIKSASINAKKASDLMEEGSPSWIRMQDILQETNFYNKKN